MEGDRREGFVLGEAPLLRVRVCLVGDRRWKVLWTYHHIILDGWCMAILLRDFGQLYRGYLKGEAVDLPEVVPYRNYLTYLVEQEAAVAEAWWLGQVEGYEGAHSYFHPHSVKGGGRKSEVELVIGEGETEGLRALAGRYGGTLNHVLQALWAVLLARHSGIGDVMYGCVVSGRSPAVAGVGEMVGLLINTLPLRVRVDGREDLGALVGQVRDVLVGGSAYEYQGLGALQAKSGQASLFDHIFVFENYPFDPAEVQNLGAGSGFEVKGVETRDETSLGLEVVVYPGASVRMVWQYDGQRYDGVTMEGLQRQYACLLRQALEGCRAVGDLRLMGVEDEREVLEGWNGAWRREPLGAGMFVPLHGRLAEFARSKGGELALVEAGRKWTYREFDAAAEQVAFALLEAGLRPEERVVVRGVRGGEVMAAIFGVLKAGGAYVPVDPGYPVARQQYLVADCGARFVLQAGELEDLGVDAVVHQIEDLMKGDYGRRALPVVFADQLAYQIYTSGSTGQPKGVAVSHANYVNSALGWAEDFGLGEMEIRLFQVASLSFDVFSGDLARVFWNGGTLYVCPDAVRSDPQAFCNALEDYGITVVEATPSLLVPTLELGLAMGLDLSALRMVMLGGEACPAEAFRHFQKVLGHQVKFINSYGLTETSIDNCFYASEVPLPVGTGAVPIGRAMRRQRLYVLDGELRPVAPGIAGDFYIGGDGVARGYHGRPGLSAERFVPDPFTGGRMYKTGDRARWQHDGQVVFLGREDDQVKIRGYRIELGEVEAAALEVAGVGQAVAGVVDDGVGGKRLVLWYVGGIDAGVLMAELGDKLPSFMVPSACVGLERLPLTPNGKVDRKALVVAEGGFEGVKTVQVKGAGAEALAGVWKAVLGAGPEVGGHFFKAGGDSIKSIQLVARLTREGWQLGVKDIFEAPDFNALAERMTPLKSSGVMGGKGGSVGVDAATWSALHEKYGAGAVERAYRLAPMQEGMLFESLMAPDSEAYFEQTVLDISGVLEAGAFQGALAALMRRYAVLRTAIVHLEVAEPCQVVLAEREAQLEWVDLSVLEGAEQVRAVEAFLAGDRRKGFRLDADPLMRSAVLRTGPEDFKIVWSHHHILMDGWCISILLREFGDLYAAALQGGAAVLPPVAEFEQFVEWLAAQDTEAAAAFWREELSDLPAYRGLPFELAHPGEGYQQERVSVEFPEVLKDGLDALAQTLGVTPYHVLKGVWGSLLMQLSGQEAVVLGAVVSGRPAALPDVEDMVGLFINTLPVVLGGGKDLAFRDYVMGIREKMAASSVYEYYPLHKIQALVRSGERLFEQLFVYENYPLDADGLARLGRNGLFEVKGVRAIDQTHFGFEVVFYPGQRLKLEYIYNAQQYRGDVVEALLPAYLGMLGQVIGDPDVLLGDLRLDSEVLEAVAGQGVQVSRAKAEDQSGSVKRKGRGLGTLEALVLRTAWQAVLGQEPQRAEDHFFRMGGDSIKAIQLVARLAKQGWQLEVRDLFAYPEWEDLAGQLKPLAPKVSAHASKGPTRMTAIQKWFFETESEDRALYVHALFLKAEGEIDGGAMDRALGALVQRHPALRMRYEIVEGKVVQVALPWEEGRHGFEVMANVEGVVKEPWLAEQVGDLWRGQGLDNSSMLKALLVKVNGLQYLMLSIHHLAVDGVSWRILLQDLGIYYRLALEGRLPERTEAVSGPGAWAAWTEAWAKGAEIAWQIPYWEEVLRTWPHEVDSGERRHVGMRQLRLSSEMARALMKDAHGAYGTQVNELLLAALGLAVYRVNGKRRVGLVMETIGRELLEGAPDPSQVVGWFTAEFPFCVEVEAENLAASIVNVKTQFRVVPDKGMGYGALRYHAPERIKGGWPRPRYSLNFFGETGQELAGSGWELDRGPEAYLPSAGLRQEAALDFSGHVDAEGLLLQLDCLDPEVGDAEQAELLAAWGDALLEVLGHCLSVRETVRTPSDVGRVALKWAGWEAIGQRFPVDEIVRISRLSPMQSGMLFHAVMGDAPTLYFEQTVMELEGQLSVLALEGALQDLAGRHEVLRTLFLHQETELPCQLVLRERAVPVQWVDLRTVAEGVREEVMEEYLEADRQAGFQLDAEPLLRVMVVQMGDTDLRVVWSHHHILMDGWCIALLFRDFCAYYDARVLRREAELEAVVPYGSYLDWLERVDQLGAAAYWRQKVAGFESVGELPVQRGERGLEKGRGKAEVQLEGALVEGLTEVAHGMGVTLYHVLQGIWSALLLRLTGADEVGFGAVVSGRPAGLLGAEDMVGLFINTLPVHVRWEEDQTFAGLVQELRTQMAELSAVEQFPLHEIQTLAGPERSLFDHLFVFENYPIDPHALGQMSQSGHFRMGRVTHFDQTNYGFELVIHPEQGLRVEMSYDRGQYDGVLVEALVLAFGEFAAQVVQGGDVKLADLKLGDENALRGGLKRGELPVVEQERVLSFNPAPSPYPQDDLYSLFVRQASERPEAVALVFQGQSMSYEELASLATRIAGALRGKGVKKGDVVGWRSPRGMEMVAGYLGILRLGALVLPLTPELPADRVSFMLEDAGAVLLMEVDLDLPRPNIPWISYLEASTCGEKFEGVEIGPDDAAVIFYTSGSTGRPKGVKLAHRGIVRLVVDTDYVRIGPGDRHLLQATFLFDGSLFDLFGALLNGATLYLLDEDGARDPEVISTTIQTAGITHCFLPTAFFNAVVDEHADRLAGMKGLYFGGERASVPHVAKAFAWMPVGALINVYGPTEASVYTTAYPILELPIGALPIGRPILNTWVYIVNSKDRLVGIEEEGELLIGGDGVALGYLNETEVMGSKFVELEIGGRRERVYRSGDICRWDAEGMIHFVGRRDQQVKVRGFRVEPGEIETRMLDFEGIGVAKVVARPAAEGGLELLGFYTAERRVGVAELRAYLSAVLPSYMVPARLVEVDALPLGRTGKVDVRALLETVPLENVESQAHLYANAREAALAGIWAKVLGKASIGPEENFFALGGHSLKAIQIGSRVMQLMGLEMRLADLFQHPTVRGLAPLLQFPVGNDFPALLPQAIQDHAPLTQAQLGLWVIIQRGGGEAYHLTGEYHLEGFKALWMEEALRVLVIRHPVLRTVIRLQNGLPQQHVLTDMPLPLKVLGPMTEDQLEALRQEVYEGAFDLETGSLFRVVIVEMEDGGLRLLLCFHHLILDGWSVQRLFAEWIEGCVAFAEGRSWLPVEAGLSFVDYAYWEAQFLAHPALERLKEEVKGIFAAPLPAPPLMLDFPRPALRSYSGDLVQFNLDEADTERLIGWTSARHVSPYSMLLALAAAVLHRHSGAEDMVWGLPHGGRSVQGLEGTLGFLVNMLPVRLKPRRKMRFEEWVGDTQRVLLEADARAAYPFGRLVEDLGLRPQAGASPLFEVGFTWTQFDVVEDGIKLPTGWKLRSVHSENPSAKYDLWFFGGIEDGRLSISIEWDTACFRKETILRLLADVQTALLQVLAQPDLSLTELLPSAVSINVPETGHLDFDLNF